MSVLSAGDILANGERSMVVALVDDATAIVGCQEHETTLSKCLQLVRVLCRDWAKCARPLEQPGGVPGNLAFSNLLCVAFAFEHHHLRACCHVVLFPLISPHYAQTGQARAFPVPPCTSCADTGLTAQVSAASIDLTSDSPRANGSTLQRQSVDNERVAKVDDSMTLSGIKRAREESARSAIIAAFGTVDQEKVKIGGKKHKNTSFDVGGDCDDPVRGSKQPATYDKPGAFLRKHDPALSKCIRRKWHSRIRICSDNAKA